LRLVFDQFARAVPILIEPSIWLALQFPEQVGTFSDPHLGLTGQISWDFRIVGKLSGWMQARRRVLAKMQNRSSKPGVV
jgi:hypothetical protein